MIVLMLVSSLFVAPTSYPASLASIPPLHTNFVGLPLGFTPNLGQFEPQVRYLARGNGYTLFLTDNEAVMSFRDIGNKSRSRHADIGWQSTAPSTILRFQTLAANPHPQLIVSNPIPGKSNYFLGDNPVQWRTNVPSYGKVTYHELYPGIDLAYYGNAGNLEYDYIVGPGAEPSRIRLAVAGATQLDIQAGALIIHTAHGDVHQPAPHIYQDGPSGRQPVVGGYILTANGEVGFGIAAYDPSRAIIIDPQLIYASYLGGSDYDNAQGIAVDGKGNVYITGDTESLNFPTTTPLQPHIGGVVQAGGDAFVSKVSTDGKSLLYSTYLGGKSYDKVKAIAVDSNGNIYLAGITGSADFPIKNALQSKRGDVDSGGDAFISKLSADGANIVYSTFLGGSGGDEADSLALDSNNNVYITGQTTSPNFPIVKALQVKFGGGVTDAFVAKLNADGKSLAYATYLGGSDRDFGYGIAVDSKGNAYVIGETNSTNFATHNAYQATADSTDNVFVSSISSDGQTLIYSTYLSGSDADDPGAIAVDNTGEAIVTGTTSSTDFPTLNAIQPNYNQTSGVNSGDAFITKFSSDGKTLLYSTYLSSTDPKSEGGSSGQGIAVDSDGNVVVVGSTNSKTFPLKNPIQSTFKGGGEFANSDAFIAGLSADGKSLIYSTYFGGSGDDVAIAVALDHDGSTYVIGNSTSTDLPVTNPLQQHTGGGNDIFVLKVAEATSQTFPETGHTVKGKFLAYWHQHGGLSGLGYPISDEFQEKSGLNGKTYTVQYFERAVFESHPENRPPYDVLLSQLGTYRYKQRYPNGAPSQTVNADHPHHFAETNHTVGGKFLGYWQNNGGLARFGYPISEEFQEKSDLNGKTYTVQYFERAVFESHPENQPPYDVLLSQLGTYLYKQKYPNP